jgi:hypothetical protein
MENYTDQVFTNFFQLAIPPEHSLNHAMDYNDILDRAGSLTHYIRPIDITRTVPCYQHESNWTEASTRAGSYYFPTEPYQFVDTPKPSLFPISWDLEPTPNTPSREDIEDSLGDFSMELSHEHALFDHSAWGDVPDGVAPHVSEMGGLDRIIFEDCVESAGAVQAAHLNTNDIPYYRRPGTIARAIHYPRRLPSLASASARAGSFSSSVTSPADFKLSMANAEDFLRFWRTIGNTESMVKEFIKWINAQGISAALKYFGNLAAQLSAAECVSPEEFIEGLQADPAAPEVYKFHPIGEQEEDNPENDYYETAPEWVGNALGRMEQADSLKDLGQFGKKAFGAHMGIHTGTFWMHYNMRKAELTPELSRKAGEIIGFIEKCRTRFRLGKYGKRLYELQNELPIPGAELAIAETDWSSIWEAYKEKKGEFGA